MVKRFLTSLAVIAACATATGRASADLVVNGGFETGDFTGWTQQGDGSFTGVSGSFSGIDPYAGTSQAFFGPTNSLGGISQTLATTAGVTYDLTFALYNFGGTGTEYQVSFGSTTLVDVTDAPAFPYTLFSFQVTASSNADVLSFNFLQPPSYFLLDSVSVVVASVPEPGSMLLMGIGAGGLGLFYRSRRNSRSSSAVASA